MNALSTRTPSTSRTNGRELAITLGIVLLLSLVMVACEIIEVQQPSSAVQGEIIEVTVTIEQPFDDKNAHRGIVSVLVPADWAFVSGEYSGDAGTGAMLEDEGWADSTEIVLPAPDGMKWIGTISDEAHPVSGAPAFFDATIRLQVGQTTGDFGLGYFTTNTAFGTADIVFGPSAENTADTLMNRPITVNPSTSAEDGTQPRAFSLAQNYPNPFRAATTVEYALDRPASVRVAVYDAAGREVAVLDEGIRAAGDHTASFDAAELPSGTYVYRLEVDGETVQTRTMTRVK